jgi:hypothetical protein
MRAGDVAEFESLSRGWDHLGNIERTLGDLQGSQTAIFELIQNADDAPGATRMRFVVTDDALEVWNDGVFERCSDVTSPECEWLGPRKHRCDFHSFRKMASGDKRNRPGTTGAFGVGFTAVYQFTDRPELLSNGEHWFVDEMAAEQDRIQRSKTPVHHDGTTFRLPWALQPSPFREAIRQEPVPTSTIKSCIDDLRAAIPAAMPFLKKLRMIEACERWHCVAYERWCDDGRVRVRSSDGESHEWLLLDGGFEEEAGQLKAAHPDVIEDARSAVVRIAVPLGENSPGGLLYATLPTEEPAHLPLLVNADFVPASDRKRIRFDSSPVSTWNRVAVGAAADLLAASLEEIAGAGDEAFVRLLIAAHELHERLEKERIEPTFGAFWESILESLPDAAVVPIETGGHGTPAAVRLWAETAEVKAAPVLQDLGISLVSHHVRAEWYRLRGGELGLRNLNLADLNAALRTKGLSRRWLPAERSDALADESGLCKLWAVLDVLLQVRDRSTAESREQLRDRAVVPGWDSALWPIADVYGADQETQDLLADVGVDAVFLDEHRLGEEGVRLAALVASATPALVLGWVEQLLLEPGAQVDEEDRDGLLHWFFDRRARLDDNEAARLAALPIFPTAAGQMPLVGLALPSEFRDELGLARLVAVDSIQEMRPFLAKLGAKSLTFARYCTDFVAEAVEAGELDEGQRRRLLELLATRLSEVRDDTSVRAALRPLPLALCTDGEWRQGDEVYLSAGVRSVVGTDVNFAAIPASKRGAHEDLYRWLGAADEPRPRDVEARCHELRAGPEGHRQAAEAIAQFVGQQFATRREWAEVQYAPLRNIPWLPAEGDRGRGHAPHAVYTMFQRTLFASRARFLDLSATVQRGNAPFLEWLGVRSVPTPKQVVDHLLWSAERNEPVREDMWIYLNQHAGDAALADLQGQRCLLIAEINTYVRPTEVYWEWHPFGRFRHQLGPKFAEYQALLNRLGVAQRPEPSDAIEVLQDVAAKHGGERAPLLEEDVRVVQACWRLLSDALDEETIAAEELATLATAEVVLDAHSWLRQPGDVFFRDSHSLAGRFGPPVRERLIDRPEGLWRALSAAGVRNLSDAVESRIVEQQPAGPGGVVAERLSARRRLILRVLAAEDHDAPSKLEAFDQDIELHRLSRLVIQRALAVNDDLHVSEAYQRGALFLPEQRAILYVEAPDAPPVWVEIAREVARALRVDGSHASGVAAAIKGLLGAESDDEARAELDELGFPALHETHLQDAEPTIADDLGGEPVDDDDDFADFDTTDTEGGTEPPGESRGDSAEGGVPDGGSDSDQAAAGDGSETSRAGTAAIGSTSSAAGATAAARSRSGEEGAGGSAGGAQGSRSTSRQSRLRSYVAPIRDGAQPSADAAAADADADADPAVERAGVDAALEFERAHGREPEEMPPQNPGFDLRSVDAEGKVRVIEVKATADEWGPRGVAISSTQFATAQQRREDFWLYVVDRALTGPRVHPINDPATKIDQYFFDDGWRSATEDVREPERPIPPLRLPASPDGVTGAVPFADPADGDAAPSGWVACRERQREDSWFAARIRGDSPGIAYRGGIAFVEPIDRDVEDDELVLVVLHSQADPDTGCATTIRRWRPERDLAGNQLALRLWSDGSVEPLTVRHPEEIVVRGVVRGKLRLSDLEVLGYC